jgi:hypothetical protein
VGAIREVLKVKPVCGVMFQPQIDLSQMIGELQSVAGVVDERSDVFDFSFSDYYEEEMGTGLKKVFLSFHLLVHPGTLPVMKLKTSEIETRWSKQGKRRVNLDPGYITGAKLVLASTKDFAHRVFIGDGIYGDVQLRFVHNRFRANELTYPDYQTGPALSFFQGVRAKFMKQGQDEKIDSL